MKIIWIFNLFEYFHFYDLFSSKNSTLRLRRCTWKQQIVGGTSFHSQSHVLLFSWHGCPRSSHSRCQQRTGACVLQTYIKKQPVRFRNSDMQKPGRGRRAAWIDWTTSGQTHDVEAEREPGGWHPWSRRAGEGGLWEAWSSCQLLCYASPFRKRRDQPEGRFCTGTISKGPCNVNFYHDSFMKSGGREGAQSVI